MTFTVKVLLTIALILSIAVPFGAFAAGERSRGRYKRALAANVFLFFGTMVFASCLFFTGNAFAAETASAASNATGMGCPFHRSFLYRRRRCRVGRSLRCPGSHQ